jgi:hypothetical protein
MAAFTSPLRDPVSIRVLCRMRAARRFRKLHRSSTNSERERAELLEAAPLAPCTFRELRFGGKIAVVTGYIRHFATFAGIK